jgi:hypothetical protein
MDYGAGGKDMSMSLREKLPTPGVVFCTSDRVLAEKYNEYLSSRTKVELFGGKTYLVVRGENVRTLGEIHSKSLLYWFELRELISISRPVES